MSAKLVQPTRPGWRFWLWWMLATLAAAGLVLSFPFQSILEAAMGGIRAGPWTATETALIIVFKGAEGGMMGLGMGRAVAGGGMVWLLRQAAPVRQPIAS